MKSPQTEIHFFHIPKTAGTSLAGMIRRAYAPEESIPAHTARELLKLRADQVPRYRCYTGHFFSLLPQLMDRNLPTVTLLRHPIAQFTSLLRHCERDDPLAGRLIPRVARSIHRAWDTLPPLRRAMQSRICPVIMNNFQTRVLGCEISPAYDLPADFRGHTYPLLAKDFIHPPRKMDILFELAKARLDSMVVVGTVERFAESADLIFQHLGVPTPEITRENSHDTPFQAISPDLRRLMEDESRYDMELYEYAETLLNKRREQAQGLRSEGKS